MSKPHAIEGVFFDLDGTLMDTADDFIFVVNQLSNDYNHPPIASDIIRKNVSAGSRTLVSLALNLRLDHPDIEPKRQQLLKHYAAHISNHKRPSLPHYTRAFRLSLMNWKKGISLGGWSPTSPKPMLPPSCSRSNSMNAHRQ